MRSRRRPIVARAWLLIAYAALVACALAIEWFVTPGDEPAAVASVPFVLVAGLTLAAAFAWGQWRALLIIPSVAIATCALFLLGASGSWWLRDRGERGYAALILAFLWLGLAVLALPGVSLRRMLSWLSTRRASGVPA